MIIASVIPWCDKKTTIFLKVLYPNVLTWIIHKKWMKGENMVKKKVFDDAAVVAALRREHRQELYFEQIAAFSH